jgi:cytochrome c
MRVLSFIVVLILMTGCNNSQEAHTVSQPKVAGMASAGKAQASDNTPSAVVIPARTSAEEARSASNTTQTSQTADFSPAVLFQACAACHGNHAEKSALNQSAIIGEWDSDRIAAAIVGYQKGTYGRTMKTLMQNQVKGLSRVQVQALSEYIANLYVKTH